MIDLTEKINIKINDIIESVTREHAIELILNSEEFMNNLYVDEQGKELDNATRDELGQFYTPGKICIQMIEKFDCDSLAGKNILDPTCGSGNLLITCLIAGADLDKLYGNEYDARIIPTCRKRILRAAEILGLDTSKFNDWQIHQGNALHEFALKEFREDYDDLYFDNKKQPAARQKRLNDISYDAYTNQTYKTKCKIESDNRRALEIDNSLEGTLFGGTY